MNQNMLKLNDEKTELIVFTSKYEQDLYNDLVSFDRVPISP